MLSIQFYSHLNWAGLPASSDSSVNCNSSESTVTNSLWPHIMSDGFQEKCLWLDTIMYSQPAIKVHRLSSVNASCVCMWGSTKCLHKYWCHVCIHTHKHHLTAVIHHSPQTYMLAHLRLCHPHLSLCLSERLRQSLTPFFFSTWRVTGSTTGSSIPLSITRSCPTCWWEDSTIRLPFKLCLQR